VTTKSIILAAIRRKCLDCSCYQPSEVRNCHLTRCDLWPYRLGRSSLYKLFNECKLTPRKCGKRTLLIREELEGLHQVPPGRGARQ
jgi:hypothetical protein